MREAFAESAAKKTDGQENQSSRPQQAPKPKDINVDNLSFREFGALAQILKDQATDIEPWLVEFGLTKKKEQNFKRNTITGLFDDQQMINQLKSSMDDPICL